MQGVPMTIAYPTKFVPTIMVEYPIFVRNDEIPTMLIENSSLHNKVCIELIETIRGHLKKYLLVLMLKNL